MHADRGVGRARPARDEADARPARQLAVRLGHEGGPALLAIDDETNLVAIRVKAVEHSQVAFTRYAECVCHALRHQALDDQMPGLLAGLRARRGALRSGRRLGRRCTHGLTLLTNGELSGHAQRHQPRKWKSASAMPTARKAPS